MSLKQQTIVIANNSVCKWARAQELLLGEIFVRLTKGKSLSKLLGLWTFFLLLILKGAFPKPAAALSTLDSCAAQPACRAALGSELAPSIAAPTGAGFGASTLSTTTATGATSTYVKAVAGIAVVAGGVLAPESTANITNWHYWSQATNTRAQIRAKQKYCAAYPKDWVCAPVEGGQGNVAYKFYYYSSNNQKVYLWFSDYWEGIFQGPIKKIQPNGGRTYWRGGYEAWNWEITGANGSINLYSLFYWAGIYNFPKSIPPHPKIYLERSPNPSEPDNFGNPPPLPWQDWPQEKRDEAVRLLEPPDWQEFVKEMPVGGILNPGDQVKAPGGVLIPGELEDDPSTPEDERQPTKQPDFTNPPDFDFDGKPDEFDPDDDNDGTPDTSDPEPQNPNVPIASSDTPELAPSEGEQAVDSVREDYDDFLDQPENAGFRDRLTAVEEKYRQAAAMEDEAATDPDAGYEQNRLIGEADGELQQLKNEIEQAWWSSLSQAEQELFGSPHSPDLDEIKGYMKQWSPGTFEQDAQTYGEGVATTIIHHANEKGYSDPLEYMRDAPNFDKSKAVRTPSNPTEFRDDDTAVWRNPDTREFIVEDKEGKIRTYGFNPY